MAYKLIIKCLNNCFSITLQIKQFINLWAKYKKLMVVFSPNNKMLITNESRP